MRLSISTILLALLIVSCCKKQQPVVTPWGTTLNETADSLAADDSLFTLDDIQQSGELIMITLTGPDTYYDYHGRGLGVNYLLLQRFARHIGVSLRVEVCRDTVEMFSRLANGEGDVIAFPLDKVPKGCVACGVSTSEGKIGWAVSKVSKSLLKAIQSWFEPSMVGDARADESYLLSHRSVKRHVYSPMLNANAGVISHYDRHFITYAREAQIDWRLMAAQCYQESTFDPHARSWAGACGLMQIMPSTADHLGLSRADLFDPEHNIAAAARYMSELMDAFSDISNPMERCMFALASYNGGARHVRDAMALARKHGKSANNWRSVSEYILMLQRPEGYNDPVVSNGYMRGSETVDYVDRIMARWRQYRGAIPMGSGSFKTPVKAKRKNKYKM